MIFWSPNFSRLIDNNANAIQKWEQWSSLAHCLEIWGIHPAPQLVPPLKGGWGGEGKGKKWKGKREGFTASVN